VVALEPGRPATLEPTRQLRGVLRLDQTAALFEVLVAVFKWSLPARCGAHHGRGRALGGRDDHPRQPARGGTLQLLLLGFGIVGAAQVVGLPSADALVDTPTNQLGWWAPWVGRAARGDW
jgi:hypothetical protein